MFTDMVGYTALSQRNEALALELLEEHRRILRSIFPRFNGTEIKTIGDAFLVEFQSALEAAQCALEIQRTLAKRNPDVSSDHRIELRIGIHVGDVVHREGDVYGDGVNIASRIQPVAGIGGICISVDVERQIHHALDARFEKLAPIELKNVEVPMDLFRIVLPWERPSSTSAKSEIRNPKSEVGKSVVTSAPTKLAWVGVLVLAVIAFAWWFAHQSGKPTVTTNVTLPADQKSIAVLPFENLSRDPDNAYFADGIQDEILTRLSKIADLKVISRTSTQKYKSAPDNSREVGQQLGVANLLEGSVQKAGNAVHINVQLIKAATDAHLWAESYDRELQNIFGVEGEVAKAIADQLRAKLTGQEEQVITAKPTDNPEAYDAYLRGLAYATRTGNNPANDLAAQKYLKEAVMLDPRFALSWALLSYVEARGYLSLNLQPTLALREEARQAAETALTLQYNLGEATLAKGQYHYACLKDYDTAIRYFEQARQLMPNSSRIPESLAYVTRRQGQWDRSEAYFNDAERLDPRNGGLVTQHALSYMALRRFPEAVRKLDRALDFTPDDVDTLALKAGIAQAEGDLVRASALLVPLHPAADDTGALETQAYQAILERRPAQIIARLKEVLANPDPALGFYNGELRFFLGWAEEVGGDKAVAQESWQQARRELEPLLKEQPENSELLGDLALTNMGLGDKASAVALSERAIAAAPIGKDAVNGPFPVEVLARVVARLGDHDRAIASLEKLLSIPYNSALASNLPLTPALLRLDPMFDPLRSDPRFQKLCGEPNK